METTRKRGRPLFGIKDAILSFQHMFAMLGATILVPILSGMSIPSALMSAGIGTIIFYFVTKRKVPVFLGSSFAFLPALISLVAEHNQFSEAWNIAMASTSIAIMLAGLVYVLMAVIIKFVGVQRVKKLFPPIVVGPVIIIIGMILAPQMFYNNIINYSFGTSLVPGPPAWKAWTSAIVTAGTIIGFNAFASPKSFLKVIPILLGFVVGYAYSAIIGLVSFQGIDWSQVVIFQNMSDHFGFYTAFGKIKGTDLLQAIAMIVPIAIVTFMEHMGDISANSVICGKDFMVDPGIHRTLMGDGLATIAGGLLGGPPNTTYGENTAVLAITKNYNPFNIFIAACLAVLFGIFSIFSNILSTIPPPVIGGASIILFGMISASGLRALVDAKVDFNNSKNIIVVSVILAIGLGLGAMSLGSKILDNYGIQDRPELRIMIKTVEVSALAIATLVGIILNLIIPNYHEGKAQYTYIAFDEAQEGAADSKPDPATHTQAHTEPERPIVEVELVEDRPGKKKKPERKAAAKERKPKQSGKQ